MIGIVLAWQARGSGFYSRPGTIFQIKITGEVHSSCVGNSANGSGVQKTNDHTHGLLEVIKKGTGISALFVDTSSTGTHADEHETK